MITNAQRYNTVQPGYTLCWYRAAAKLLEADAINGRHCAIVVSWSKKHNIAQLLLATLSKLTHKTYNILLVVQIFFTSTALTTRTLLKLCERKRIFKSVSPSSTFGQRSTPALTAVSWYLYCNWYHQFVRRNSCGLQSPVDRLSTLISGRLVWRAVLDLLHSRTAGFMVPISQADHCSTEASGLTNCMVVDQVQLVEVHSMSAACAQRSCPTLYYQQLQLGSFCDRRIGDLMHEQSAVECRVYLLVLLSLIYPVLH